MFVKLLISLISFILAVALILGVVFTVREIKDVFSDLPDIRNEESESIGSDTGGGADSGIGGSTGNTSIETTQSSTDAFYIDEVNQTGYRTIAGVTYFFKVLKYDKNACALYVHKNGIKLYSSYELFVRFSRDMVSWEALTYDFKWSSDEDYGYATKWIGSDSYLCYTRISGCTNPKLVLEDLNQNVFLNPDMFTYDREAAFG